MAEISQYKTPFRIFAALIGWAAVFIQYVDVLMSGEHANIFAATLYYFGYFTILTNILATLALTAPFLAPTTKLHRFFEKPAVRAAIALYIFVVAAVYHTMLARLWQPKGIQLVTDISFHTIMPALYLLDWFFFAPKRPMRFGHIPYWIIFPFLYGVFTIIRGALSGVYPYPFMNITELGMAAVLINMAGFTAFYAVGGAAFIGLGRLLSKSNERDTP